jgi:hypothetical protein
VMIRMDRSADSTDRVGRQQNWTKCKDVETSRWSPLHAVTCVAPPDRCQFALAQSRVGCINFSEFGLSRTR